ncbi:hypothetical protein ACFW61_03325 [Streptomyces microflavus]|uniref:hypothetical protein n=1 Tax=Streptomyces TaxID=1883 RepID=UPI00191294AF|nr:hypothetical protein [Streptomyces sp. MBT58]MBK5994910.1 hypothetical protein [Streptomyces sp. MBT58]
MEATPEPRPPRPTDPETCRLRAEGGTGRPMLWALLAIAGELHEIRKLLARRR